MKTKHLSCQWGHVTLSLESAQLLSVKGNSDNAVFLVKVMAPLNYVYGNSIYPAVSPVVAYLKLWEMGPYVPMFFSDD